jgi:hypothetical protein
MVVHFFFYLFLLHFSKGILNFSCREILCSYMLNTKLIEYRQIVTLLDPVFIPVFPFSFSFIKLTNNSLVLASVTRQPMGGFFSGRIL